jgi:hypothetical protein
VRTNPYPWREVVAIEGPLSGRGSRERAPWRAWQLTLRCKHKVVRKVRYRPRSGELWRQPRAAEEAPPVKVRCERCPARISA